MHQADITLDACGAANLSTDKQERDVWAGSGKPLASITTNKSVFKFNEHVLINPCLTPAVCWPAKPTSGTALSLGTAAAATTSVLT